MRKLSIFKYLLIPIVFLTSCSDYLEIDNPSAVTDLFYDTKSGQEKLLIDVYVKYRSVFNTGELQYYGTDLFMAVMESPNERMFNGYDPSFNSTAGVVGSYWSNLYKIVQETNILLTRCTMETPDMTLTEFNSITAQGRFLRALAYYYLVETFGPVPLYNEEQVSIIEEASRTPEQEVYSFMLQELNDITDLLPWQSDLPGMINNAAVLQLLGKIYLTRAYKSFADTDDFANAAIAFDKIIEDSEVNYKLLDNYADVFDEFNQNNEEIIWAIQYGLDKVYSGGGNPQQSLFGFNIVALEPDLFIMKQADYSNMNRLYWISPQVHELYTDPILDSRYDVTFQREFYVNNTASPSLGELGVYFPRWNDESGDDKAALKFYPFKVDSEYSWYPQSTAIPLLESGLDRMPRINKFKDTEMQWGGVGTREDVIFRLGETYLLSAEAYLGMENNPKALERVNTIRRRAAVADSLDTDMEIALLDMDVLMDERARELLGEHDRWFHLKRTGTLIERTLAYNIFVQKYDNINPDHLVRPIPQDEINKVKGLIQNTGY